MDSRKQTIKALLESAEDAGTPDSRPSSALFGTIVLAALLVAVAVVASFYTYAQGLTVALELALKESSPGDYSRAGYGYTGTQSNDRNLELPPAFNEMNTHTGTTTTYY